MLLSASQEARAGQDLAPNGLNRGQAAVLSGGVLNDDEAGSVLAAAMPPQHTSGAARSVSTPLASSSMRTHGSETLDVVSRVSFARVLHVHVGCGRAALRARDYRCTVGK